MNNSKNSLRKLPEFAIDGAVFTVDARVAAWNKILPGSFGEAALTNILFDIQTMQIYKGNNNSLPEHVVRITISPVAGPDTLDWPSVITLRMKDSKKFVLNLTTPVYEVLA